MYAIYALCFKPSKSDCMHCKDRLRHAQTGWKYGYAAVLTALTIMNSFNYDTLDDCHSVICKLQIAMQLGAEYLRQAKLKVATPPGRGRVGRSSAWS